MRFTLALAIFSLLGCHNNQGYKVVSFSDDPTVRDPLMQTLGHKITLDHNGVRITAHCWLSERESADTGCPMLESKVGETVTLDYWKLGDKTFSDVLVYRPHGPNNSENEEMIRVASATTK